MTPTSSIKTLDDARRIMGQMQAAMDAASRWRQIPWGLYDEQPKNNNSIWVGSDALFPAGRPAKALVGDTVLYGISGGMTDGVMSWLGPALTDTVQALWLGGPDLVHHEHYTAAGVYANSAPPYDILYGANKQVMRWMRPTAYCVHFAVRHWVDASGGQVNPYINLAIHSTGQKVSTANSGNGIQASTCASGTAVENPAGSIDAANYKIEYNEFPTILAETQSSNAADFNAWVVYVME